MLSYIYLNIENTLFLGITDNLICMGSCKVERGPGNLHESTASPLGETQIC